MEKDFKRRVLYVAVAILGVCVVIFLSKNLSYHVLNQLVASDSSLHIYVRTHIVWSSIVFSLLYVLVATFSLPLESALCIVAGYYFGAVLGTVISVFSATTGATLVFFIIKRYLHDWIYARIRSPIIKSVTNGIRKDAFAYILFLRLITVFPYFLVNIALALSSVRARDYIVATFIGIIPSATVFVLAGTQIETIRNTGEVLTPETLGIFLLLALFSLTPLAWKRFFVQVPDTLAR